MKYKIKQIDSYAVVISDEPKINDYHIFENEVKKTTKQTLEYINSSGDTNFKKVIATISPYSIEGLPMLELPNQEENVEKLFKDKYKSFRTGSFLKQIKEYYAVQLMMIGYKAAQKQYSEEDMRNVIKLAVYSINPMLLGTDSFTKEENRVIQSLQKKQFPIAVELEIEQEYTDGVTDGGRIRRFYGKEDFKIIKWHYE